MEELSMERKEVSINLPTRYAERRCSFNRVHAQSAGAILSEGVVLCGGLKEKDVSTDMEFVVIQGPRALEYAWWCQEHRVPHVLGVV